MKLFLSIILLSFSLHSFAQNGNVTGRVMDNSSKLPIIGARVILNAKYKALSDEEGKYVVSNIPYGTYKVVITAPDLDTLFKTLTLKELTLRMDFLMGGSIELEEVKVIANIVSGRETPIAVTTIGAKKIQEELGSQDLPMLLNGTPGVQATQTGGGDGDSRITVRGFDQRNVGVMIDGVPVNDMENGSVYWSNWFGLDNLTANMQVQRGLGATKLAMPSVGGTLNILTQSVGSKKGVNVKQEFGTGNLKRFSVTASSGTTKSGFGVLASASYKVSDGWLDGNSSEGFFGYIKLQQKLKNHLISFSAFAAPQKHGQRPFKQSIRYWDSTYMGAAADSSAYIGVANGIRYNQHWGYRTSRTGQRYEFNESQNFYNKPQFTLKDFWKVNDKLSISTIAYVSIGRGGGSKSNKFSSLSRASDGTIDWDKVEKENQVISFFGQSFPNVDVTIDSNLLKSSQVITSSINNHFWTGLLGQFSYKLSDKLDLSGGLDFRSYKGSHYRVVTDLLGGDYYANSGDLNSTSQIKKVGDKISEIDREHDRLGLVRWAGSFGQAEYKDEKWSAFLNVSVVGNFYKGVDYFKKKVIELSDTTLEVGAYDVINYKGTTYTNQSEGAKFNETKWVNKTGYTFKGGAAYKLNKANTVFVNLGYLSRTPQYSNVIDNNTNTPFINSPNELIRAIEAGYSLIYKDFGINLNGYYTNWKNKPIPFGVAIPDPLDPSSVVYANVSGMDALHIGGELDIAWQITKKLNAELMFSYGDWTWQSAETVYLTSTSTYEFDARGVHVGDAAQIVQSAALRWEPVRNFYVRTQFQYFDKYYANFNPFLLKGANAGRDSWKMPSYGLLNAFVGYKIPVDKYAFLINVGIMNLLNKTYISDAQDSQFVAAGNSGFNAASAGVFFGQGRRFNISMALQF